MTSNEIGFGVYLLFSKGWEQDYWSDDLDDTIRYASEYLEEYKNISILIKGGVENEVDE